MTASDIDLKSQLTARTFEFITIARVSNSPSGKTHIFKVCNKRGGYRLGLIVYRPGWRQYVFEPEEATEYSAGCLADIADFMREARRA